MKCALAIAAVLGILLAADIRMAVAADMDTIDGELDLSNSLLHCTEPTDCTVVMPTAVITDRTTSARALDLMIAGLAADRASSDSTRQDIIALVGDTVGGGMVPSESVLVEGAVGIDVAADRGETGCVAGQQADIVTLSVTVAPNSEGSTERSGSAAAPASKIQCDETVAIRSVSVARFGHDAGFVRAVTSTWPINEFPIAGSKPASLAIRGVIAARPYPFRSAGVSP